MEKNSDFFTDLTSFAKMRFHTRTFSKVQCCFVLGKTFRCIQKGPPFRGGLHLQPLHLLPNGEGKGTPLQYSCLENPMDWGAWWATVHGVAKSRTWLSDFSFTFHFHALEKEMATHFSVLAWRIPGTGEPGGLPSMGSHRVGHDWSDSSSSSSSIYFPKCHFFPVHGIICLALQEVSCPREECHHPCLGP